MSLTDVVGRKNKPDIKISKSARRTSLSCRIQKQAKLIYGDRNQDGATWGGGWGVSGWEGLKGALGC